MGPIQSGSVCLKTDGTRRSIPPAAGGHIVALETGHVLPHKLMSRRGRSRPKFRYWAWWLRCSIISGN